MKHKIISIIAKLDNGSHSASQLAGADEALFALFKAAQLRLHLTAFGVGILAFFAGIVIGWFVLPRKHGGR